MTGPEHWAEAERLLANIQSALASDGPDADLGLPEWTAIAQVHATLATAAAFLAVAVIRPGDRDAWDHAMGITEVTR